MWRGCVAVRSNGGGVCIQRVNLMCMYYFSYIQRFVSYLFPHWILHGRILESSISNRLAANKNCSNRPCGMGKSEFHSIVCVCVRGASLMDTRARRHARSAPQNFHTLYDHSPALPPRVSSIASSHLFLPLFLPLFLLGFPPSSSRPVFPLLPSFFLLPPPSFLLPPSSFTAAPSGGRRGPAGRGVYLPRT